VAVLLDKSTKVIAVAATGAYGRNQIQFMRAAGTDVVGVVALGRGGQSLLELPVFDTVEEAVSATGATAAIIYAPALGVRSALFECADAGLLLAVAAAEFVPAHDTLYAVAYARERGMHVVGPNTVGMASPGQAMLGAVAPHFTSPGSIGIISRSGTLTLLVARLLTRAGFGQSTIVHVGGDVIAGSNPDEWLGLFAQDEATSAIVFVGEIGGTKEYALAERISTTNKPVASLIVGRHAPAEKRMGHAGALVGSDRETAAAKQAALAAAGATTCNAPEAIVEFARSHLRAGASGERTIRSQSGAQRHAE
jgi:succinyl-CoA synthetase alpha subunit